MEWPLALLLTLGSLIGLMLAGIPVAFCFLAVNLIGAFIWWGGEQGLMQIGVSLMESVTTFVLLPIPLFILMGEVIFRSEIAPKMIDAVDKWLGRVPGRLGLLAVGSGTLLSTLTGVSMASVAILGSTLVPEMERRGYKKPMSLGPILGSGAIAMFIPPSALAVLLGAIAQISIGKLLVAIIVPGMLMAAIYTLYIILRCKLQPSLAPVYDVTSASLSEKLAATVRYVLPIGFIIFLVIGVILMGIATPTEAAASGSIGCFLLAAGYRKLNWEVAKKSIMGTFQVTVMLFMVMSAAIAFSQILIFSGVSRGLIELATGLLLPPIIIIIIMQVIVLIMGMFMEGSAILMVTIPLFMPIISTMHFNPMWFGVLLLLALKIGGVSPPFGLDVFTMKGVAPPNTTIGDIYRAALPFIGLDLIVIALITAFPVLVLWLPGA
ncbi:TRAP transporter large permease subunit [Chloroflexota bacterium]